MRQIVYFSTAADRQDDEIVSSILNVSRKLNRRDRITGLLVAGGHRYLQIFEGPAAKVASLIARICRDPRHVGVSVLVDRKVSERSFEGWTMAYFDDPKLGEYATFGEMVETMLAELTDQRLRKQVTCFKQRFDTAQGNSPWALAATYNAGLALDRSH